MVGGENWVAFHALAIAGRIANAKITARRILPGAVGAILRVLRGDNEAKIINILERQYERRCSWFG
jgi:hypothetical protein